MVCDASHHFPGWAIFFPSCERDACPLEGADPDGGVQSLFSPSSRGDLRRIEAPTDLPHCLAQPILILY